MLSSRIRLLIGLAIVQMNVVVVQGDDEEDLARIRIPPTAIAKKVLVVPSAFRSKLEEYWLDGVCVGERLFYDNGQVLEEKLFDPAKQLHGIIREFHRDGRLFSEEPYRHGVPDGQFSYWNENGEVLGTSTVRKGNGVLYQYLRGSGSGGVFAIPFRDGKIHGVKTFRGDLLGMGRGMMMQEFTSGIQDGWDICIDENERVRSSGRYKSGHAHGVTRGFDAKGQPRPGYTTYVIQGRHVSKDVYLAAAAKDPWLMESLNNDGRNVKLQPVPLSPALESSQSRPSTVPADPGTSDTPQPKSHAVTTPSTPAGDPPSASGTANLHPPDLTPEERQQLDAIRRGNTLRRYWPAAVILASAMVGWIAWRFRKSRAT